MSSSPAEEIVARQLQAYNRRDIEAFMACWHEDAQMLVHPAGVLADGAGEIRARHEQRFEEPDLFARLVGRFSVGNMVVDREVVVRTFPRAVARSTLSRSMKSAAIASRGRGSIRANRALSSGIEVFSAFSA